MYKKGQKGKERGIKMPRPKKEPKITLKKQPKAEPPKKRGRPKKQLNYEAIEKLASIHCTQDEIASFLGVSVKIRSNAFHMSGFCHDIL